MNAIFKSQTAAIFCSIRILLFGILYFLASSLSYNVILFLSTLSWVIDAILIISLYKHANIHFRIPKWPIVLHLILLLYDIYNLFFPIELTIANYLSKYKVDLTTLMLIRAIPYFSILTIQLLADSSMGIFLTKQLDNKYYQQNYYRLGVVYLSISAITILSVSASLLFGSIYFVTVATYCINIAFIVQLFFMASIFLGKTT